MPIELELSRLVALVTGGGRGIGRSIALALARAGATTIIADLDRQLGQKVADEIAALGHKAAAVHLDVTDMESVSRAIDEAIRRVGHIDVLVNNAGVFQECLGFELRDQDFNHCLDVNVTGIWRLVQVLAPHFKSRGGGRIVNIASNAGRRGLDSAPAYSASKAAVINLTQGLAAALGPHNINVNAICPGAVETAMLEKVRLLMNSGSTPNSKPSSPINLPLAATMTAEDIAHAVVFFASDYARSITGQALNIDRGQFMN